MERGLGGEAVMLSTHSKDSTMTAVRLRLFAASALVIVLSACGKSTPTTPTVQTIAPRAVELTQNLSTGYQPTIRSSALLGVYLTEHLVDEVLFHSALAGVAAQMSLLSQSGETKDDTFALLQTLGSILQVDIADMLNRSSDRATAFDTYMTNLQNLTKRAQANLDAIKQHLTDINKQHSAANTTASKTQSLLNTAVRNGDYTTASDLQKTLIDQKAAVAKLDADANGQTSLKNLFTKIIDVANKRLAVMAANRAAFLAGVTVTDLPGAKDLGILKQGNRSPGSIFDPSAL